MGNKKVFVSGCYDMLHSGHVAFFEEAAWYGDLYVGIGSDKTIFELKARKTINTDAERLYMVKALRVVKDAWINSGSGLLDFEKELRELKPDIFFVNTDGNTPLKAQLCKELGIEYIVSNRIPHGTLPVRSTTMLRKECRIPYRIDLAGGWLDQPYVSKYYPGPVLTICIEPDYEFNDRSGMSTSSRKKAIELWQTDIPEGDKEKLAKTLFCYENPPGTPYVSGSQDALGIVMPGLNKYEYNVLADTHIDAVSAKALSDAARCCWDAILNKDLQNFGVQVKASFDAQIAMFPNMVNDDILAQIEEYRDSVLGWKLSGAGGGGYLTFISEKPVEHALQIRIRR